MLEGEAMVSQIQGAIDRSGPVTSRMQYCLHLKATTWVSEDEMEPAEGREFIIGESIPAARTGGFSSTSRV